MVVFGVPVVVGALVVAGCARPGAGMTRLVPEGLSGCPSGSSFPVPVFTAMLVPWHDLKLRICSRAANQHAPT